MAVCTTTLYGRGSYGREILPMDVHFFSYHLTNRIKRAIMRITKNAMKGNKARRCFHRELPEGERQQTDTGHSSSLSSRLKAAGAVWNGGAV